jgi:hypothetical protein|tara:strand:- start:214 stop:405 length:192 start_codon:yes stop_codon:yes gene_type:complete
MLSCDHILNNWVASLSQSALCGQFLGAEIQALLGVVLSFSIAAKHEYDGDARNTMAQLLLQRF